MRTDRREWLLPIARLILVIAEIIFVVSLVGLVIGIIALLTVARPEVLADLAAAGAPGSMYLAIISVLVLLWAIFSLSMLFVRQLRAIVDSVDKRDPFHPENAARLARMAWYALGIQACQFAIAAISASFQRYVGAIGESRTAEVMSDVEPSLTGLGLAVTLFILAGVFRKGAEMREELEGTV